MPVQSPHNHSQILPLVHLGWNCWRVDFLLRMYSRVFSPMTLIGSIDKSESWMCVVILQLLLEKLVMRGLEESPDPVMPSREIYWLAIKWFQQCRGPFLIQ